MSSSGCSHNEHNQGYLGSSDVHEHTHQSYLEANRAHFDSHAPHGGPETAKLAGIVTTAILDAHKFSEDSTTVLDYACGTGKGGDLFLAAELPPMSLLTMYCAGEISKILAGHAKSIVGVDISQTMVDRYNLQVWNQGISPEEMKAIYHIVFDTVFDILPSLHFGALQ